MRDLRDERGAVAVITAMLLVVLLGFSALVIDVGGLYHERRILQNGADAAALAVAQTCATGTCDTTIAPTYAASNNAVSGLSITTTVCGHGGGLATGCSPRPPLPSSVTDYVMVTTNATVPYTFARVLGQTSGPVKATAVVAWGGPSSLDGQLPLTISACEFNKWADPDGDEAFPPPTTGPWDADGDADLAPPPPYTGKQYPLPPYKEATIYFHNTTGANNCPIANNSGADLPGGFGWLQTSTGCQTATSINNWFNDSTGRPPPNSCTAALMQKLWKHVVQIPIYTNVNGLGGSNGQYYILYYASFYLTGYSIEGQYKQPSIVQGNPPCGGSSSCISGYFVNQPQPVGGTVGGPSTGVTTVQLIG
jgi:Flp pilus assembly protein TadG